MNNGSLAVLPCIDPLLVPLESSKAKQSLPENIEEDAYMHVFADAVSIVSPYFNPEFNDAFRVNGKSAFSTRRRTPSADRESAAQPT